MSTKSAMIRARMKPQIKKAAEEFFNSVGLSTSEAIDIYFHYVILHQELPFKIKKPNKLTRKTLESTDRGEDLIECKDLDELFAQLEI
jgi:DNA-damage-inducible protein J